MQPLPSTLFLLFFSAGNVLLNLVPETSAGILSRCDSDICSSLVCAYDGITVNLNVQNLNDKKVDITNIHLQDRRCTKFPNDGSSVKIQWSLGADVCGTEFIVNASHAIYKNHIYLPPDPAAIIVREVYVVNVTCAYPLDMNISSGALRPDLSTTYISTENSGQFKVKLDIYDKSYTTANTDPVIILSTKSLLYVGVKIEEGPANFNLLMIHCYSTPTKNTYDPLRYEILIDSCPNPTDGTINVVENGVSTMGKFNIQMFKFIGDYSYVYLHCEVHLCDSACQPTCSGRRSASNTPKAQRTLSFGPIVRSDFGNNGVGQSASYSTITIIVMAAMMFMFQ